MESVKELFQGLLGIHELDETKNLWSKPTTIRKLIGIFLNLCVFIPLISTIIAVVSLVIVMLAEGHWLIVLLAPFLGVFALSIYVIAAWVFIDWEKNRLRRRRHNA